MTLGGCHNGDAWYYGFQGKSNWQPYAQNLADLLGVPVTASPEYTRWNSERGLTGTSKDINGPVQAPGQWKTFYPW